MHFTLHMTTACNMRCSYCYAPPRDSAPMSLVTAQQTLELASQLCEEKSAGIIFFGGEPLMHKDLIQDTIRIARNMESDREIRFHFKMTTNGLLLDDEFIDYSVRNDLMIALSCDGIAEAHDTHRKLPGGTGSHAHVRERMIALLEAKPYSSIIMVVNPDTAQHLADSVTYLIEEMGVRYLICSLNYAGDWHEEHFRILEKQYRSLAAQYIRWTRAGRKFYFSPFEVKLSSHINKHCYRKERCELARHQLSVDPEGYLFPCVQFPQAGTASSWCLGHVSTGIDEEVQKRIHDDSEAEKEFCKECAIKERCNNTCGCLNWQTTGNVNGISPVLCRHEQLLVPLVDRVGERLYKKRDPLFLHKHYNSAYPVLSLLEDLEKESS